jgi:poly-beta-1,6-N-acetyl-D-glucosamine synthase
MSRRYCVISPCRDEEKYVVRSVRTVLAQSEPPTRWIVVDDGSTDRTPELLRQELDGVEYASVVRSREGGERVLGSGVIRAFNAGLQHVDLADYDYVVKLDLDLDLPSTYFATVMDEMEKDPTLGTLSGKPFFRTPDGKVHWEISGDENSVGMVKVYRTSAFAEIGGLVSGLMWDAIDCHEMRRKGWRAASISDDRLAFEHLRPMGSSDRSILRGRARHGSGQWFMGTGPLFLLSSAVRRLLFPPKVVGSAAMVGGYLRAALRREPRYGDAAFRKDLRRFHREALILGKPAATRRWEALAARTATR